MDPTLVETGFLTILRECVKFIGRACEHDSVVGVQVSSPHMLRISNYALYYMDKLI